MSESMILQVVQIALVISKTLRFLVNLFLAYCGYIMIRQGISGIKNKKIGLNRIIQSELFTFGNNSPIITGPIAFFLGIFLSIIGFIVIGISLYVFFNFKTLV